MSIREAAFGVLQRVGRAFMLPIAILPVAGLLLGIGGSFTNTTMLQSRGLLEAMGPGTVPYAILSAMAACGEIVFANLPLIFAIGVAIGMAKKEKEVAALAGAVAFFVMHAAIGSMLKLTGKVIMVDGVWTSAPDVLAGTISAVVGIQSLQMGVFGGIIVGLGVAALHNRYYKIELPQMFAFFGGTRFVPIVSALVFAVAGILFYFVWPVVQNGIYAVGGLVLKSGYGGTWIYGIMERVLIPFGLHHVFYMPFWQTGVGGSMYIDGALVEGAQRIFFAELASPNTTVFSVEATRFMSGKFPFMIFGLPAAAYAMYRCASPEKRKIAGGLLFSAALTSVVTGITEPIEFTFLFVSLPLYGVHCILAGASYMLMHIFNVGVGMTFSGGFIDLLLFGILQGNDKTHWLNVIWVGLAYAVVYYFLFSFIIKKFNLKTPGREDGDGDVKLYTRADVNAAKAEKKGGADAVNPVSVLITEGLGGKINISDVDSCATRLRVTVLSSDKVDESKLKQSGAAGVIRKGNGVQVIYGPQVSVIKSELVGYLESPASDNAAPAPVVATPAPAKEEKKTENKTAECKIYAPIQGEVKTMQQVPDDVFAQEILGKGMAIEPAVGRVVAPADGTIVHVADTKHAVGVMTTEGVELLIHVGVDTVKLDGKFYTVKVTKGQNVKRGDLLLEFDMAGIKAAGYPVITPVIISNTDDFAEVIPAGTGQTKEGDLLMTLKRK